MKHGVINSLWRYPVKSLQGEQLKKVEVDSRGIKGDRLYAISNPEGKFGSGKNTRRFRRIDGLLSLGASLITDGVTVRFPDGSSLNKGDIGLDQQLSETLGQPVSLTRENDIPHFDAGAVHIMTTASLLSLQQLCPDAEIAAPRFRPNIVIDCEFTDQELIGKTLHINDVVLEITGKTERCRMVALDQPGYEYRPEVLKTVSQHFGMHFGVYASVIATGTLAAGDNIRFADQAA
ncbi:MOSC domain-containing protein [Spongorhabdus nitratireducens]